ncbi:hypothetical protein T05_1876 [Trichinella murrelli]|uniref:Uncharacterized protein n=1 Tax=Trichinella murrelli TaxID=144512 RepID=A0A0V0T8B2_9BILA|nr:hypothetical protein T05_1876 [Trichinella murrelli]
MNSTIPLLKSLFMKCFNFCCCIGTKRTYHAETKNLVFYVSIFYFSVFYGLFFMSHVRPQQCSVCVFTQPV